MASRVSRPLETSSEREGHDSIFQQPQTETELLLPKSSFRKCKSRGFLPKFSILSQDPGASVELWRA